MFIFFISFIHFYFKIFLQVWMLTGDKLETAICIAKSSKLVSRTQEIHVFSRITDRGQAHLELNALRRKNDAALVVSGDSLQVRLSLFLLIQGPLNYVWPLLAHLPQLPAMNKKSASRFVSIFFTP
jgi:hypothetical protein